MRIDLTCPLELSRAEVLQDDHGRTRGYLDVQNLSAYPIRRASGCVTWLDAAEMPVGHTDVAFEGLRLSPHGKLQLKVASEFPSATSAQLELNSVEFSGDVLPWNSDDSVLVELDFRPEPPSLARGKLIRVAGDDAVCYPERFDDGWLCVCGRLNLRDSLYCVRCLRSRESVFSELNREAVSDTFAEWEQFFVKCEQDKALAAKNAEEKALKARIAERKRRERRRLIVWSVIVGVMLLAALFAIGILVGLLPNPFIPSIEIPMPAPTQFVADIIHST